MTRPFSTLNKPGRVPGFSLRVSARPGGPPELDQVAGSSSTRWPQTDQAGQHPCLSPGLGTVGRQQRARYRAAWPVGRGPRPVPGGSRAAAGDARQAACFLGFSDPACSWWPPTWWPCLCLCRPGGWCLWPGSRTPGARTWRPIRDPWAVARVPGGHRSGARCLVRGPRARRPGRRTRGQQLGPRRKLRGLWPDFTR